MKGLIRTGFRVLGFDLVRNVAAVVQPPSEFPSDLSEAECSVLKRIAPYTMTSVDRQVALIHAVRYLVQRGIDGCFVECGVWRGGSSMAAALTLKLEGVENRHLYLFDTFEGMTKPTNADKTVDGTLAQTHLDEDVDRTGYWCVAGLEEVRRNMHSTGYPRERVHFIKGPVETTIPSQAPAEPVALLRLDTDWYESTRHELIHLYPRLVSGGVLLIDDYGHWEGARRAVDEFLAKLSPAPYLHRIDYTGRLLIKP